MQLFIWFLEELFYITGIEWLDGILCTVTGIISFSIAFFVIGFLAPFMRYGSSEMSKGHWIIRLLVFVGLWWLLQTIANVINHFIEWMNQNRWMYIVIGGVTILFVIICLLIRINNKKAKHKKTTFR